MNESLEHKKHELGSNLQDNLNQLMNRSRVCINQLSRNTGLSNTTIKRMCTELDSNPTMNSVIKISEFFGVTPNQLIGIEPLKHDTNEYYPNFESWTQVPVLEPKQTIAWPSNIEEIRECPTTPYVKIDMENCEQHFALIVNDDSLEPRFSRNTVLIFEHGRELRQHDYVLIHKKDNHLPQFRQLFIDGPDIYLQSVSPLIPAGGSCIMLDTKQYSVIGVLIRATRSF